MTIRIYGAGMAGLLAATMLRRYRPIVHEAQDSLPDNHGALLRFRTNAVARETLIPFRRVRVLKAVKSGGRLRSAATIADTNQYAYKVTGEVVPRSVLDLDPCERYIAPDDFLSAMSRDVILKMRMPLTAETLKELEGQRDIAVVSTIPMPALMKIAGWDNPGFRWKPVWSYVIEIADLPVDVYQTVYYPDPEALYYRASLTGNRMIIESTEDFAQRKGDLFSEVFRDFGLPKALKVHLPENPKRQEYGKLLPIPEAIRHEFILAMTDRYNIYSVGRFATWRQILLDDVVQDVQRVEEMIRQRNAYTRRLAGAKHA